MEFYSRKCNLSLLYVTNAVVTAVALLYSLASATLGTKNLNLRVVLLLLSFYHHPDNERDLLRVRLTGDSYRLYPTIAELGSKHSP